MRASKRDHIVDAATALIRRDGVRAASIAKIIAASESSAGSVYHHFANKNEIVLAVARKALVEPLEATLAAQEGQALSPGTLLRLLSGAVVDGTVDSSLIVQLWAGAADEPQLGLIVREQMEGVRRRATAGLVTYLREQGVADAELRANLLAVLTMGQMMGLLAQRTMIPDFDQVAYLQAASRMLDAAALGRLPA
ncbi:TetR/AcrR family transcriptional regulator [Propioniciclava coleopterorum]|uniref:TetR/AcrR family transcriptional regulator n=1 Tax=Propioniciclava coleopterorum TaxID=2714937 RepID=A0A6G7Y3X6_9ACTN|nr:TetR/AcrR family transcriptional regulator [Propioniciclava coleopterorum]QIK71483.1 TetR/AcrR family transcriptional regulator [Propioniciclava coleopterorum]